MKKIWMIIIAAALFAGCIEPHHGQRPPTPPVPPGAPVPPHP